MPANRSNAPRASAQYVPLRLCAVDSAGAPCTSCVEMWAVAVGCADVRCRCVAENVTPGSTFPPGLRANQPGNRDLCTGSMELRGNSPVDRTIGKFDRCHGNVMQGLHEGASEPPHSLQTNASGLQTGGCEAVLWTNYVTQNGRGRPRPGPRPGLAGTRQEATRPSS
jgi:hypothetical protein